MKRRSFLRREASPLGVRRIFQLPKAASTMVAAQLDRPQCAGTATRNRKQALRDDAEALKMTVLTSVTRHENHRFGASNIQRFKSPLPRPS
jgi:hypothetical protein